MSRPATAVCWLILLAAAGCAGELPGEPAAGRVGDPPPEARASLPAERLSELGLMTLPAPDLEGTEPAVARQLRDEQAALAALLRQPDTPRQQLGETFGRLGQLYHAYALRQPAGACYRNAARLDPEDSRWHYYLGVLRQEEGDTAEAVAELTQANELEPYVPALVRLGDIHLGLNRPDLARPLYARALEAHPTSAAAHYGLGRVASAEGDFPGAIERFEKALELQPQADRIHYLLGQAYRRLGDLDRAREHLERSGATQIVYYDPRLVEIQRLTVGAGAALGRGAEARMQGQYEIALREYRSAAEADPRNPAARRSYAAMLAVTGDVEGAVAEFREAIGLEPDRPDAEFALGHLLYQQGRPAEARPHLERAAALDPRQKHARLALGAILAAEGEWEAAAARYREILAFDEGDAEARLNLGKTLVRIGRPAEGMAEFDAVLELETDRRLLAQAHHGRAMAQLQRGGGDEVIAELERALELDADFGEARFALGHQLIQRRRFGEAIAQLDRLVELEPENVAARLAQMAALVFAGRTAEARQRLEEGTAALPESRELKFNLVRLLSCGPEAELRDGGKALPLARELYEAAPILEHAETLAMALAEAGRFGEAAEVQRRVLDEARRRGNPAFVRHLQGNLERYERGETCQPGDLGFQAGR